MNNGMQIFDYEDIQMIPNKCVVRSRKEVDTSVKFGPHTFKIPVVPANMQTIIDEPFGDLAGRTRLLLYYASLSARTAHGFCPRHEKARFNRVNQCWR